MKLDSIIYDKDALADTLIQQWTTSSPTFSAMYPSETTTALVNVFAAYGSMLQYCLVSAMANCYTETAFSERGIYQLAITLGNIIHGNISARVQVKLVKNNLIGVSTTIPAETQFDLNGKSFFNPHGILFPAGVKELTDIALLQGKVLELNKTTTGVPYERFYFSSDFKCNHDYVTVTINGEEWSVSDSFLEYDKSYVSDTGLLNVVVLKTDADGRSYIKLGDNQLGNLPAAGSAIKIRYVSNEGMKGNIGEIGTVGALASNLMYIDAYGQQSTLDLEVTTTTTAYGGSDTQSIETLRYTSPYVFASGHRAIRRQDYNALLQSQCGYLTTNVWGEYEEAQKAGSYDAIMMNMVYYTGLKSFETYPFTSLGDIKNKSFFEGSFGSTKGFEGSHNIRISNKKDITKYVTLQDTGAAGQLFINDDALDKRDSILPTWLLTNTLTNNQKVNEYRLSDIYIINGGDDYVENEIVTLDSTDLTFKVLEVSNGKVTKGRLLKKVTKNTHNDGIYNTTSTQSGTGLRISISLAGTYNKDFITTNDDRTPDGTGPAQVNPISNAISNASSGDFYLSSYEPTLLNPVQIRFDYSKITNGKKIAAVKFKSPGLQSGASFIGSFAMYGINSDIEPSYDNIRNNKNWTRIIDRTDVANSYIDSEHAWTDWFPTNCLVNKDEFKEFNHFVIEIYSLDKAYTGTLKSVSIGKMKVLYEEDASFIYYDENADLKISLPTKGMPGNEGSPDGYLLADLLDESKYLLYDYNVEVKNITKENGYRNGNMLAYVFKENDKVNIPFIIKVVNIDNQIFKVYLNNDTDLTGNTYIETPSAVSIDDDYVYTVSLIPDSNIVPSGQRGHGYSLYDIITIKELKREGDDFETVIPLDNSLQLKVTKLDQDGGVEMLSWINNTCILNKDYFVGSDEYKVTTVCSGTGTGLTLNVRTRLESGANGNPGNGGKVEITSKHNLEVTGSFNGNKIDSQHVNYLDQPIMEKYNHFTTYMEFKQPQVIQVDLIIQVSLSTSAANTSAMIIQDIKNNVNTLFKITPDCLGKGLKLSDIYTAVMDTKNVNWCKVNKPTDNIDVANNALMVLSSLDIIEVTTEFK